MYCIFTVLIVDVSMDESMFRDACLHTVHRCLHNISIHTEYIIQFLCTLAWLVQTEYQACFICEPVSFSCVGGVFHVKMCTFLLLFWKHYQNIMLFCKKLDL